MSLTRKQRRRRKRRKGIHVSGKAFRRDSRVMLAAPSTFLGGGIPVFGRADAFNERERERSKPRGPVRARTTKSKPDGSGSTRRSRSSVA